MLPLEITLQICDFDYPYHHINTWRIKTAACIDPAIADVYRSTPTYKVCLCVSSSFRSLCRPLLASWNCFRPI